MSTRFANLVLIVGAAAPVASAQLTLLPTGPQLGTHAGNLVTNGSFEIGGPGAASLHWATGTALTPFGVPGGWASSGSSQTYARWGNDGSGPPAIATSVPLPDGANGLYFGNGAPNTVSAAPTFLPSREVTFSGAPSFTMAYGQPCRLWQTVPTNTAPAPSYILSFWVSGEGAGLGPGNAIFDGIFGLKVTNTAAGDPIRYFQAPSGSASPLGSSTRYEFSFVPLNPLAPVTIEFINWGHLDLTPWGRGAGTTELVLDDVMVNAVPAPGAAGMLVLLFSPRRRRGADLL